MIKRYKKNLLGGGKMCFWPRVFLFLGEISRYVYFGIDCVYSCEFFEH